MVGKWGILKTNLVALVLPIQLLQIPLLREERHNDNVVVAVVVAVVERVLPVVAMVLPQQLAIAVVARLVAIGPAHCNQQVGRPFLATHITPCSLRIHTHPSSLHTILS